VQGGGATQGRSQGIVAQSNETREVQNSNAASIEKENRTRKKSIHAASVCQTELT
jgi:hypothetical protein